MCEGDSKAKVTEVVISVDSEVDSAAVTTARKFASYAKIGMLVHTAQLKRTSRKNQKLGDIYGRE
ncbi:BgTH12-02029 [Blumeria graminis f. sp. triticale]|uniref:BgTH12-02029 n=1 Tax=Blumeria graminis f. sp. triticale TaxID=1689686 RepID=A0A9W4D5N6_BLUGR|nr:BgTH12-02029 [Blumeria graminis f. sp. triticale]